MIHDKKEENNPSGIRFVKIKDFKLTEEYTEVIFKDKDALVKFVSVAYNPAERQWENTGGISIFEDSKRYYALGDKHLVFWAEK